MRSIYWSAFGLTLMISLIGFIRRTALLEDIQMGLEFCGISSSRESTAMEQGVSQTAIKHINPTAEACVRRLRVEHYKNICNTRPVHFNRSIVHSLIVDRENRIVGCLNNKVGTRGWRNFVAQNKKTKLAKPDEGMKREDIPLSTFQKDYGNWTKYILVRHPLQRLVSGYYQAIVAMHSFPKQDGSTMNFSEFSKRLVEEHIKNVHWRQYIDGCQMCDISFDYILKQETLLQDVRVLDELIGLQVNATIRQRNLNSNYDVPNHNSSEHAKHINKYDTVLANLQQQHPMLMKKVMEEYQYDMDLFWYGWNWPKAASSCTFDTITGTCC